MLKIVFNVILIIIKNKISNEIFVIMYIKKISIMMIIKIIYFNNVILI